MLRSLKRSVSAKFTQIFSPTPLPDSSTTSDARQESVDCVVSGKRPLSESPDQDCLQTPLKKAKQDTVRAERKGLPRGWSISRIFNYVVRPNSSNSNVSEPSTDSLITPGTICLDKPDPSNSPTDNLNNIEIDLDNAEQEDCLVTRTEKPCFDKSIDAAPLKHNFMLRDTLPTHNKSTPARRASLHQISSVQVLDLTNDSSSDDEDKVIEVCEISDPESPIDLTGQDDNESACSIGDVTSIGSPPNYARESLHQISKVNVLDLTQADSDDEDLDQSIFSNQSHDNGRIGEVKRMNMSTYSAGSIRLDECNRYRELLAQFTTVTLPEYANSLSPPRDDTVEILECSKTDSVETLSPVFPKRAVSAIYDRTTSLLPSPLIIRDSPLSTSRAPSSRRLYKDVFAQGNYRLDCSIDSSVNSSSLAQDEELPAESTPGESTSNVDSFLSPEWYKQWNRVLDPLELERDRQIKVEELKAKRAQERQLESLEQLRKEKEERKKDEFVSLTNDQLNVIKGALGRGNPNEKFASGFNADITRNDLHTLKPSTWLNDEVVNFYFNLIKERGDNEEGFKKVHVFNTFFYPKVMKMGHSGVKRWTRKVDIFSHDLILIPVHLGMHWCLSVIDFSNKKICYYDSLKGNNMKCIDALKGYLDDESKEKRQQPFDLSDWSFEMPKSIPQQKNGCDCGVFMCKYAEWLSRDMELTFEQEHMPYFRQRMVYEIISKKLL